MIMLNSKLYDASVNLQNITIVDTTLRDGEQTAGVVFSAPEKFVIAKILDEIGIREIEVGVPVMGLEEQKVLKVITKLNLKARLIAWNRIKIKDIKASLACGIKCVHISAPVSDIHIQHKLGKNRAWVLENLINTVRFAVTNGCEVSVGAEDASRADEDFLLKFAEVAQEEGAMRLPFADTLGVLDPFSTSEKITRLVHATDLDIEFHGHNDFGMATANTIAAVKAGAKLISTTVNGIGERAGNASMEEVIRGMQKLFDYDMGINTSVMPYLSKFVAKAANRTYPDTLPERDLATYVSR